MKYFLLTLGCQMNKADSQRLESILNDMGIVKTEEESEANILGIMSCSVRQRVIDRVYNKIQEWNLRKNRENILTFVSGCILPKDERNFLKKFDLVFRVDEFHKIPDLISQCGITTPLSSFYPSFENENKALRFWKVKPNYSSSYEAFVPIQNGCDKFCSFCAVPYTRGREVSRHLEDILSELEYLINNNYKIITLLGQNVNSYGSDIGIDFTTLLEAIGKLSLKLSRDDFWIYFTSPHPRDMQISVLETIAKYKVLANWIHLPMQSGNDKILIKMNRNHSMQRYRDIVNNVREILPEATLFTDIIVGFSGEVEEQFNDTKKACWEFKFNMCYIAMYSPRPGALSYKWRDDVSMHDKKRRRDELYEIMNSTSREYNERQVGKTFKVIVISLIKDNYYSARTEGKIIVRFFSAHNLIGEFCYVNIKRADDIYMEGEFVSK